MKRTFENKPLRITIVLLFLLKLIFCFSSYFIGFLTFFALIFKSGWLLTITLSVAMACTVAFLISLLLLAINRKGARVASVALIVFYILDMLLHLFFIFSSIFSLPFFAIGFLYDLTLVVLLVRLRHPRPNAPTNVTNIDPTKV